MKSPQDILDLMLKEDAFTVLLGMKVTQLQPGSSTLTMQILPEHVNGFNITHGGITFSLADSAIAFAANAYGNKAVSIENSISYIKPSFLNDQLTAHCEEVHKGKTLGRYTVKLLNEKKELIAKVNSTVHFSKENW
ncbi:MAG: PaaI family thioesterase [Lishizhenia sp.]